MGKRLIQQARGKGGPTYRAPSHRYKGSVRHKTYTKETIKGTVIDIINCPGHTAPIAQVEYEDGEQNLILAPEGMMAGQEVMINNKDNLNAGNTLPLKDIPEGTSVYNIENKPGDGGKFVKSSGNFAKIINITSKEITVMLPSKKKKIFHPECRANIGTIGGGGRTEKPFIKAGNKYHAMKAKNKLYPKVSGASMNAVDHPFGGARSSRKGRPTTTSRNAPPGRKVGMIAAKKTGRSKERKR